MTGIHLALLGNFSAATAAGVVNPTTVIQSFTATSSWTCPTGVTEVEYLVVAGGGGGGASGGGGGAGGFRTGTGLSVTPGTTYTVTVGSGGIGGGYPGPVGANGSDSIFSTITSAGGGRGGSIIPANPEAGSAGGSGGGGAVSGTPGAGGAGNTPSVSPSQGNNGGSNYTSPAYGGGGGGGAGAVGGKLMLVAVAVVVLSMDLQELLDLVELEAAVLVQQSMLPQLVELQILAVVAVEVVKCQELLLLEAQAAVAS